MKRTDYMQAIWSGLLAGLLFLILEMIMVPLFAGGSPWGPPRMIAGILLGSEVVPPPANFQFGIVLAALVVHFILSVIYALIIAAIVHRKSTGTAMLIGTIIGIVIYLVNFYGFTYFFPWFANARNWITVVTHIVFGLASAGIYVGLEHRVHAYEYEKG